MGDTTDISAAALAQKLTDAERASYKTENKVGVKIIHVVGEPIIRGTMTRNSDGNIVIPLVGEPTVTVTPQTLGQAFDITGDSLLAAHMVGYMSPDAIAAVIPHTRPQPPHTPVNPQAYLQWRQVEILTYECNAAAASFGKMQPPNKPIKPDQRRLGDITRNGDGNIVIPLEGPNAYTMTVTPKQMAQALDRSATDAVVSHLASRMSADAINAVLPRTSETPTEPPQTDLDRLSHSVHWWEEMQDNLRLLIHARAKLQQQLDRLEQGGPARPPARSPLQGQKQTNASTSLAPGVAGAVSGSSILTAMGGTLAPAGYNGDTVDRQSTVSTGPAGSSDTGTPG